MARQGVRNIANPRDFAPDELLIKFRPGASHAAIQGIEHQLGAHRMKSYSRIDVHRWRLGRGLSVEHALEILSKPPFRDHLEYAEPNYLVYPAQEFPDDSSRGELWGLHNLGQTGGKKDADIDALEAWQVTQGSSQVVVGVIDTGVDYSHVDLSANIWTNPGEIPGNGVDDDDNGYVDDIHGWDFSGNGDNNPMDFIGHGTHVAGTIGAVGNNSLGVVGVNWQVRIMPLKFFSDSGVGYDSDAIEAILYASSFKDGAGNQLVRITNNSWGRDGRSRAVQDAIAGSGTLFVAAAGNAGSSSNFYPAAYSLNNIVSVAATDYNDLLASFSNYGSKWVDLGAPGVDILSTIPGNDYAYYNGTSMAAPHVAGVAALILERFPALSLPELKARILNNVDQLPPLQGKTVSGGRLNARRAVDTVELLPDADPPGTVINLVAGQPGSDSVPLTWPAPPDNVAAYLYDVRYLAGQTIDANNWDLATRAQGEPVPQSPNSPESFTVTGLAASRTYYLALKVADAAGNFSSLSNLVSATTPGPPAGSWTTETVDPSFRVGNWSSLALDGSGNPRIAYNDYNNNDAKYAELSGGAWSIATIPDPDQNVGRWTSLALDAAGHARMTYFDDTSHKLRYAQWTGSEWLMETVDKSKPSNGNWNSIALDTSGNAHVSYRLGYDNSGGGLKYTHWTGSRWETTLLDASRGAATLGTSIALDQDGNPLIAYHDHQAGTLRYARWTGTAWELSTVDGNASTHVGEYCSLALDSSGNPHISYFDSANGDLKRAYWTGAGWATKVVDSQGMVGWDTSIKVDSNDDPHISYYDIDDGDLKYARLTANGWVIEAAQSQGDMGWYTSLALDADGDPHISYTGYDEPGLKYARKSH